MTGRELQREIRDLARATGWRVAHFPSIQDVRGTWRTPVAADGKGFPDLLLVRERIIVIECKGEKEPLRPEQEGWLTAFRIAGVIAYVWKPSDLTSGTISLVLRARSQEPFSPEEASQYARYLAGPEGALQGLQRAD